MMVINMECTSQYSGTVPNEGMRLHKEFCYSKHESMRRTERFVITHGVWSKECRDGGSCSARLYQPPMLPAFSNHQWPLWPHREAVSGDATRVQHCPRVHFKHQ